MKGGYMIWMRQAKLNQQVSLLSFSTGNPSAFKSAMSALYMSSGITGERQRIHKQAQVGPPTTAQLQESSSLTTQQSPATGEVGNFTFSLALVRQVSLGSGTALPQRERLAPSQQQVLMTLIEPSSLKVQLAMEWRQSEEKRAGMEACSYHIPRYRVRLTQGTVLGGSRLLRSVWRQGARSTRADSVSARQKKITKGKGVLFIYYTVRQTGNQQIRRVSGQKQTRSKRPQSTESPERHKLQTHGSQMQSKPKLTELQDLTDWDIFGRCCLICGSIIGTSACMLFQMPIDTVHFRLRHCPICLFIRLASCFDQPFSCLWKPIFQFLLNIYQKQQPTNCKKQKLQSFVTQNCQCCRYLISYWIPRDYLNLEDGRQLTNLQSGLQKQYLIITKSKKIMQSIITVRQSGTRKKKAQKEELWFRWGAAVGPGGAGPLLMNSDDDGLWFRSPTPPESQQIFSILLQIKLIDSFYSFDQSSNAQSLSSLRFINFLENGGLICFKVCYYQIKNGLGTIEFRNYEYLGSKRALDSDLILFGICFWHQD